MEASRFKHTPPPCPLAPQRTPPPPHTSRHSVPKACAVYAHGPFAKVKVAAQSCAVSPMLNCSVP
jgi:hypothetical protein